MIAHFQSSFSSQRLCNRQGDDHYDRNDDNEDNDDDVSLEEEQGGDSNQVVLGKVKFRIKVSENALGDGILIMFGPKGPAKHP